MLFNGKYYNKPGHLGMTRDELKKALRALPKPEVGDAGKPVVVNEDGDGYVLGGGGGGEYEIELSYDGTQKAIAEFETSDEADAFITNFFKKYDLISANITDFPLVGTVPMILHSNGVNGYFAIAPFITGLVVGFITLAHSNGGIGYVVNASFSSFDVALNEQ